MMIGDLQITNWTVQIAINKLHHIKILLLLEDIIEP